MTTPARFGILFMIIGTLVCVYGKFSYTKSSHETNIGSVEIAVKEKETVNVPIWIGIATLSLGTGLLILGIRK